MSVIVVGAADVAQARRPSCAARARGANVLAATSKAKLFQRGGSVYGCWRATRRTTRLASGLSARCHYATRPSNMAGGYYERFCHGVEMLGFPRLSGHFAAWVRGSDNEDAFTSKVTVADVRAGHGMYVADSSTNSTSLTYFYVRSLALDGRGRTVWGTEWWSDGVCSFDCSAPPASSDNFEVWARDGSTRLLDSGAGVNPRSPTIRRTNAVWRRAGIEQTTPLR
ncbi:MAG: hypothetical protein ABR569_09740 [Gaiellaceae bacterium]